MINIKDVRKGITQQKLADKLFVSQQAVNNWEAGKTLPSTDKLKEICDVCDTSLEELLLSETDKYIEVDITEEVENENTELHNKENLSENERFRKIFNDIILKRGKVTYGVRFTEQELNAYKFFKSLNPKITLQYFCKILNAVYLKK